MAEFFVFIFLNFFSWNLETTWTTGQSTGVGRQSECLAIWKLFKLLYYLLNISDEICVLDSWWHQWLSSRIQTKNSRAVGQPSVLDYY